MRRGRFQKDHPVDGFLNTTTLSTHGVARLRYGSESGISRENCLAPRILVLIPLKVNVNYLKSAYISVIVD